MKGVIDRRVEARPEVEHRAVVVLVAWVRTSREDVVGVLLEEAESARTSSMPGSVGSGKVTPQSTTIHLRLLAGPKP